MKSKIYNGYVMHERKFPVLHKFTLPVIFFAIDVNEIENLKKALKTLVGKEALIIQLYFVEELNIYEIAEVLEVTTGRVSQIKTSAIRRIREELRKDN